MEEDEAAGGGDEEEDEDPEEFVHVAESLFYLHPLLRLTAFLHSCIAFSMMVAYYCLKVIIVIIKPLGYKRVYLPLCKVADTLFYIQRSSSTLICYYG